MEHATSADGTDITFDRTGSGPPVILVCGGSVDRMSLAGLAELLAPHFTVLNYDRRGRGESGDTPPYAVEREVEDIDAVAGAAGGAAFLFGSSSGAALAMEAAIRLEAIMKLAMWEPPFLPEGAPKPPEDTAQTFHDLVAADRRDEAAEFFMRDVVRLPPEFVEGAKQSPFWAPTVALAHTLEYDARIMADYSIPTGEGLVGEGAGDRAGRWSRLPVDAGDGADPRGRDAQRRVPQAGGPGSQRGHVRSGA